MKIHGMEKLYLYSFIKKNIPVNDINCRLDEFLLKGVTLKRPEGNN